MGGKAYATSKSATKAFEGGGKEWDSDEGMPQWLRYELTESVPICKISFRPRIKNPSDYRLKDCPKSYRFEGSRDNVTFKPLLEMHDVNVDYVCKSGQAITKLIPQEKVEKFQFYRLWIEDVRGRTNGHKFAVLGSLQFFSYDDDDVKTKKTTTNAASTTEVTEKKITTKLATTTNKCHSDPSAKKCLDTVTTKAATTTAATTTKEPTTTVVIVTLGDEYKQGGSESKENKNTYAVIAITIALVTVILIAIGVSVKFASVVRRRRRKRQVKEAAERRQQRLMDLRVNNENGVKNGVENGVENGAKHGIKNGGNTNLDEIVYLSEFDSTASNTNEFSGASGYTSGTTNIISSRTDSGTRTTLDKSSFNESTSTTITVTH